jgi:hypothetical protein
MMTTTGGEEIVEVSNHTVDTCEDNVLVPCDGEEQHWVATRLVPDATPFTVFSIDYQLGQGGFIGFVECDVTLAHVVELYVMSPDDPLPAADPEVLAHFDVQEMPAILPADGEYYTITLELDEPIELADDQHLVVAIQYTGDVSGGGCATDGTTICVTTCSGPGFENDQNFWSNSATPPFPWVSIESFGLLLSPFVRAYGTVG